MYEPGSDVAPWSFFNMDQSFSNDFHGYNTQHDVEISHEQYIRDGHCATECENSSNDEIYGQGLLQEKISQVSISEPCKLSYYGEKSFQDCTVDLGHSPSSNHRFEHEGGLGETGEAKSLCSSSGNRSYDLQEHSSTLGMADGSELDGEVEKRLQQMIPIPHVPRINQDMPSIDEANSDHQRLLDRLQLYDFVEHKVQGDGNCQFRALSDQLYQMPEHHIFVRQQVVNQLKAYPEMYKGYVPMEYSDYLERMSRSGEWGDHVTLQATADSYGVKILVITSFQDTCYIEILPKKQKSGRVVCLSFWAEVHYNSIYPREDQLRSDF